MQPALRDALIEGPPRERVATVRYLLALGWAPARILCEAPYLAPALVAAGDASRDRAPRWYPRAAHYGTSN